MMFTCTKCGKKAKTSYERTFGDRPTFEPVGYYCHACGIFYDAATKRGSKVVYGVVYNDSKESSVAKNDVGGLTADIDQERIQTLHKTYTNASKSAYENAPTVTSGLEGSLHETRQNTRARRDSHTNGRGTYVRRKFHAKKAYLLLIKREDAAK